MPIEREVREHCEKVLPDKVCREIEKVIRDKGIEVNKEPKAVVRPEPIIKDGKVVGGKVTIEVNF